MPFTPYHVGPALLVALALYPLLDIPTFIIATFILDFEPFFLLFFNQSYPLHGTIHSLTTSLIPAVILSFLMYLNRFNNKQIMVRCKLPQETHFKKILITSVTGVWLHILFDAFVYKDVTLLYPLQFNPLLNLISITWIQIFSIVSLPLAFITYFIRVSILNRKHVRSHDTFFEDRTHEPKQTLAKVSDTLSYDKSSDPVSISEEILLVSDQDSNIPPEIFIGSEEVPNQWGVIGQTIDSRVGVDLNEPHIVFVCGKQGSGKGYTIGVISEMLLSKSIPGVSSVHKSATIIVFHKPREDFKSEYWSIIEPNHEKKEVDDLFRDYGLRPRQIIANQNLRIFVDPFVYKNELRKFEKDYNSKVYPIGIKPNRLTAEDWPYVLSIGKKTGSIYVKKIFQIIKKTQYDKDFGLKKIRNHIDSSDLNPNQKSFANMRLDTLQDYLVAGDFISDLKLGGVNIFDLRKIMMEPDDIFSVMILLISAILNNETTQTEQFVFVINEAHDYLRKGLNKDFTDYINYLIRKKRHAGTWLMLDTHFPEDVDPKVIKGSDIKIFHTSDVLSSKVLKQIVTGTSIPPHKLQTGQAIIRADKSNKGPDILFIVKVRPRLTHHGGATKTAI
jgi:membrane-bound metal-dependent hydrolase YbcI (DUF457 family)